MSDEPFVVEIERAHIELPAVESRMLEDNIGYVRLSEFGETGDRRAARGTARTGCQRPGWPGL